ncbi:sigma-54 dependent transcriptional regulator [Hahella sp. SMD15-11]|uniref:Sigma-54 dependent transcriptional regulator n=1 Tax=Thermohahella caldifontis TaxID=3142973 RepID=A0AB39UTJ5_9GAMM
MNRPRILVVDDDESLLRLLELRLFAMQFDVATARSGTEALARCQQQPFDLVLTDLRMDDLDGMELFDRLHQLNSTLPVVIMTAHGSIPEAVEATRRGVVAFLTKPIDTQDLERVLRQYARPSLADVPAGDMQILTRNDRMKTLLDTAQRVAASDVHVLITGESGTGKELMAQFIHRHSPRQQGGFVAVNCGALPEGLMEAELFGFVKGAFTGALRNRDGLFRQAAGGTLFLDEIGEMPLPLQVKLLRALQEKRIRPVGSDITLDVDVRIVSATHVDLETAVQERRFREDLYYRINVVNLHLPPLRERREDIPLLVKHFIQQAREQGQAGQVSTVADAAMQHLVEYHWPGNIRQLQNVVQRLLALCPGAVITPRLVADALGDQGAQPLPTLAQVREDAERRYLVSLLTLTEGVVSEAARIAGRNRTDLYKILNRYGLDPAHFKPRSH